MTAPTLTISRPHRDALYDLIWRRGLIFGGGPAELGRAEGVSNQQVCEEIREEGRLKDDLAERDLFDLTMPVERLRATLTRLRDDAERAQTERPMPWEPREDEKVRKGRLCSGAYTCKLLLEQLDPPSSSGEGA